MIRARELLARPTIFLSACLASAPTRWDGRVIVWDEYERLRPHVDFVVHCPEIEIGLGVPRPALRIVQDGEKRRLSQPDTGRDVAAAMRDHAARALAALPPIDGFILKARSPSCAVADAGIFAGDRPTDPFSFGAGLFAAEILRRFKNFPITDETRLADPATRENFLGAVFVLADFRRVRAACAPEALRDFQARHRELASLDGLVAQLGAAPLATVLDRCEAALQAAWTRGDARFELPPGI